MKKAIEFLKSVKNEVIKDEMVHVYGWQLEFDEHVVGSVFNVLIEKFEKIENLAPLTNENRPGDIKPRYYVTVHDTGDADPTHTAKFWSDTVKNEYWEQGKYACSYQYVVGNDGIYHNIPDNEVAWHAGDTTQFDYNLYDAGVEGTNEKPLVDISEDGYYTIDGKKTTILAPRYYKQKNGEVLVDRVATKDDFNTQGVLCKLVDGKYYIGETYLNSGYMKICNRGGNNNSIGIESCINKGADLYLTWQRTAKLVARLLIDNNLGFDDVKQHHYFSGKNCPQTIRMSNNWDHFMDLVKAEYQFLKLTDEGYSFTLIPLSDNVTEKGRVLNSKGNIKVKVKIEKDGIEETIEI